MKVDAMNVRIHRPLVIITAACAMVVASILLSGCPERITGTHVANQAPVVYFVNIPPEDFQTSRNPIVYWIGTDADGQVRQFRYVVVLESAMGTLSPDSVQKYVDQVVSQLPRDAWTYREVIDTSSSPNPQTQSVVRMSADLSDPINTFLGQYVFLQAFDEQGMGSKIVWRRFFRNDNPPQTVVRPGADYDAESSPFINAESRGGVITGVRVSWFGEDKIDYPSDPPPFEYQWKLLGPYTFGKPDREFEQVLSRFMRRVFNANNGRVYTLGDGDSILFYCDSLDTLAEPDTVVTYVCDTMYIDTISRTNSYGVLDSMLIVESDSFKNDPLFRLVDSSQSADNGWVPDMADTFYNVYSEYPADTTSEKKFIFWARCRDDANVPDQVPNFIALNVIEPKYEREVLIVDFFNLVGGSNRPYWRFGSPSDEFASLDYRLNNDSGFVFWRHTLQKWTQQAGRPQLDLEPRDYLWSAREKTIVGADTTIWFTLKRMLQYKIIVLINDDVKRSAFVQDAGVAKIGQFVFKAIDAGVNVLAMWRSPGKSGIPGSPPSNVDRPEITPANYQRYFGVNGLVWSGWITYALDSTRIEDFIGAYSVVAGPDAANFPDLVIDTALLHRRYVWGEQRYNGRPSDTLRLGWRANIAALPEVGWATSIYGAEPLYIYKSKYGNNHPLGYNFTYEGSPVAVRFGTNTSRTAHFSFTPNAMDTTTMQTTLNTVLDWLYPQELSVARNETINRYQGAAVVYSPQDVARNDYQRSIEFKRSQAALTGNQRSEP